MQRSTISSRHVLRGLVLGLILMLLLLGAAGWVAARQSLLIREGVARLARDQFIITRLTHEVQMAENAMTEILHRVARTGTPPHDSAALLRDLDQGERQLAQLSSEARTTAGGGLWHELDANVGEFSAAVHRALDTDTEIVPAQLQALFTRHDRVVELVNRLIRDSSERLAAAEREIERQSEKLRVDSARLLGASFILAVLCALTTVAFVRRNLDEIQRQSGELDRVSWHMLQGQEQAARRFSHELHDELGQSLAAVRSNLTKAGSRNIEALRADCLQLVDESIANVRELSQLLRPVILDDFGLEAGLQWLVEKFAQRTRLQVEFKAENVTRYADETETHLFRIAQEALTNVARHAQAKRILLHLRADAQQIRMVIEDDGIGLPSGPAAPGTARTPSIGMVGMKARARQCGGELTVREARPRGLRIEVRVPVRLREEEGRDD
jgi:signal transduction histidine kinase